MSSFVAREDVIAFNRTVQQFLKGTLSSEEFRPLRLLHGVYRQRQTNQYMLRLKIPQGNLTSYQLERIARITEEFAGGQAHLTTRQDIQLYGLNLIDVCRAIYLLYKVGITTREASGNVVRNITACHLSGVCEKELFDVTPYAELLTHSILRNPQFQNLPRKFKVAFSACPEDCSFTSIHDLGLIAQEKNGQQGFKVVIGGGLGAIPHKAQTLEEFIPCESLISTVHAILKIFNKEGDRKPKSITRFKFLVNKLGIETFRKLFYQEKETSKNQNWNYPTNLSVKYKPFSEGEPCNLVMEKEFLQWKNTNTHAQKQGGFNCVEIIVPLGNFTVEQMRAIAKISRYYSDGSIRLTNKQNIVLFWINPHDLMIVYIHLKDVGLDMPCFEHLCDITSCPGASSCPSAITNSSAMGKELIHFFQKNGKVLQSVQASLKISGCQNSCSQHQLSTIGLSGRAITLGGRAVPCYEIYLNTQTSENEQNPFSQSIGKIPAARVPYAIARILHYYQKEKNTEETLQQFLHRTGPKAIAALIESLTNLLLAPLTETDYKDWGSQKNFELKVNASEC